MSESDLKTPKRQTNTNDCPDAPIKKPCISNVQGTGRSLNNVFDEVSRPKTPPSEPCPTTPPPISRSERKCPGAPRRPVHYNNMIPYGTFI